MPIKKHPEREPSIIGVGLLALDLLVEDKLEKVTATAGGTCGNVMVIMASLGWKATPIARIGADATGHIVTRDLKYWHVDVNYSRLKPEAATPVIVEKLRADSGGVPFHSFSFSCRWCGARLPGYQPVTALSIQPLMENIVQSDVLFIDRASRAAFDLARAAATAGMIVVFEPSAGRSEGHFAKILEYTHILKYSQERFADLGEMEWPSRLLLEVQTLGRGGLRFRRAKNNVPSDWQCLQANLPKKFVDSCGSGDWATAGILHALCRRGLGQLKMTSMKDVVEGLSFAQRLGSWNCEFAGARGGMYKLSQRSYKTVIKKLYNSKSITLPLGEKRRIPHANQDVQICLACEESQRRRSRLVG